MNRINTTFTDCKKRNTKLLIPYITAGDPNARTTLTLMHRLVEWGADMLEIGMPFSDPIADGPVIQAAHHRALTAGMTLEKVFELCLQFRTQNNHTPLLLMGYVNPVMAMGEGRFVENCSKAGIDGVLLVDMPPEEDEELVGALKKAKVAPIFLLAPTTDHERMKRIAEIGQGFLYYVSLKGVTGSTALNTDQVAKQVAVIRKTTQLPIGVGFGISDGKLAGKVAQFADAVIVGSAVVRRIEKYAHQQNECLAAIQALMQELRQGIDAQLEHS